MTERISPESWNGWHLDVDIPALVFDDEPFHGYQIDLDRMLTSGDVLFWVIQIFNKPWGSHHFYGFIQALYDLLDPHDNLAHPGFRSEFTSESIRERVTQFLIEVARGRHAVPSQKY